MKTRQYTIRNVPENVDQALRRESKKEGLSMNQLLLNTLKKETGLSDKEIKNHDLDWISSSWVSDKSCEKALKDQRVIDSSMWR